MSVQASTGAQRLERFIPVSVDTISDDLAELDLYLKHHWEDEPTLYRPAGVNLTDDDRARLAHQRIEFLYIPSTQHQIYRRAMDRRLEELYEDADLRESARARAVRSTCARMIEELLHEPVTEESVEHVSSMAGRFAKWALEDEAKFSYLLDMSQHDFYTATHMLNVGVGCGLLAAKVRPGQEGFLAEVVQGGLLHDVGKREIDPEILNKEKDLSPQEWRQLQQHPVVGFEQLREAGNASRVALQMTRWHHERLDGRGYPDALAGEKIPFSARLCAVVDAYDALTSGRPYRQAIAPLDALAILEEGVGAQFDPDLFAAWRKVVEDLIEADPQRTFHRKADEPAPQLTLDDIFPEVPLKARCEEETIQRTRQQDERRAHARLPVQVPVVAAFLHQCKPYPVPLGEPWEATTLDCSQGGACLLTPWPLARGDVLEVQLRITSKDGRERLVRRYAVVRNVHQRGDDAWTAGVRFIENPQNPYKP